MEEYFLRRCVTSDDAASSPGDTTQLPLSAWQSTGRAERVLVQENRQAHGASRAILSAIVDLTLQSPRTSAVVLFTLLTHLDYSGDVTNFQLPQASSSGSTPSSSHLLTKILDDINLFEVKAALDSGGSRRIEDDGRPSRPIVVVLDSINVLLQQFSLQRVLFFLRQLHSHLLIGSVIIRLNAGAEPAQVAQVLAAQATAVVLVETQSSLRAYPLLSKERRREIPQGKHGFVLLVRQKKVSK
ncbi:hypothetical protein BBJ28_00000798 [Nothophytophthora sp. Chile5]|nr:hypothetical protein BBJ28_00000798 [Nothophytophthora sp. Chile5]